MFIFKNYLKLGILFFGISFLLTNCEKNNVSEAEALEIPPEEYPFSITSISFSKADKKFETLKNKYNIDSHTSLQPALNTQSKTSTGNSSIIIYTDVVKEIAQGNYTSYTMLIESLDDDPNTFYNLTIEEKNGVSRMFVTQYRTTPQNKSAKNTLNKGSTSTTKTQASTKTINTIEEPVGPEDFGNEGGNGEGGTSGGFNPFTDECDGLVITTNVVTETPCGCGHGWEQLSYGICVGCSTGYPTWPSIETNPVHECIPSSIGDDPPDNSNPGNGSSSGNDDSNNSDDTSITTPINQDGSGVANDCNTSKEDLKKIFPNASDADMKTLAHVLNEKGTDFGIDTKEELRHFLAQAAHETGGFKKLGSEESLYYKTKSRLLKIFPKYFSETDTIKKRKPDSYLKNSSKLANYVYCCRMGNGKETTGDGYKYRGRGIFQLTGKTNYTNFKSWYNAKYDPDKDFVKTPESIKNNDTIAILSALWYYKTSVIDKITVDSTTTVAKVTKKVNGGTNGLADRKEQFKKAKDSITCK